MPKEFEHHTCGFFNADIYIVYRFGNWELVDPNGDFSFPIKYCPFCGEELGVDCSRCKHNLRTANDQSPCNECSVISESHFEERN